MRKNELWFFFLVILAMPFLFLNRNIRRGDSVSRKRKMSSLIGVAVLGVFVIIIVVVQSTKALKDRAKVKETEVVLNEIGEGFAHLNQEIITTWAKGEYQDAWGNHLILVGDSGTVMFISKGPDGELGTKDDMRGEIFIYETPEVDLTPIVKVPKKKSLVQKTKETAVKATGLWGKAKGLFSKDDKDVDGTNTVSD